MKVFINSPLNYEGEALEKMRKLLAPQELPCFTMSWIAARCREIKLDLKKNTAVVR